MGNQQGVQEGVKDIIRSGSRMLAGISGDRQRHPPLSSTWSKVRSEAEQDDDDDGNGFVLNGTYIPEVVLELILSFVPPEDILKVAQVCRAWKDITVSRSYWKLVCLRNGIDWNSMPENLKEKETAWMVFYAACAHNVLNKNFVQNHSGHEEFNNWVIVRAGGDRFTIETPPVGIPALPSDPRYGLNDSAFVTSFEWCTQRQVIDLWEAGLTPAVMMTMIPFQIICTEMVGSRFDCGGMYKVLLALKDETQEDLVYKKTDGTRERGAGWAEVSLFLVVPEGTEKDMQNARYLVIQNDGKDNQFWAGHYGTKFSRISVFIRCLTPAQSRELVDQEKDQYGEEAGDYPEPHGLD